MKPLVFLKATNYANVASQFLRIDQTHQLLRQHIDYPISINTADQPSIIVVSKMASLCMADTIKRLFDEGVHFLVSDMVDLDLYNYDVFPFFHAHIATSYELEKEIQTRTTKPVFMIPHGIDQRFYAYDFSNARQWSPGYIGGLGNTKWLNECHIKPYDCFGSGQWAQGLSDSCIHWCIRNSINPFKPFTKGVIAGYCKSPVIILRGDSDSNHWLDDDYPLLCDDTLESVSAAMELAKEAWSTPKWDDLVGPLIAAHERVRPKTLANYYLAMLEAIQSDSANVA